MAGALGWDAGEVEGQAEAFLDEARAEGIVTTP
jgi:hypothetical protein